ncbi:Cytochrome P450 4F5 [Daldinia childiae]|uniref:Cytochrome P450 4F5 n=1 Tax=Daldinia childiae TaxID=326645 RepID=UPI001446FAB3|nr:Cytochrome P450 4F5 [Daldinia childiae]KAF3061335.1 Cytochrome P450 4F5 [Daldinia childiae]
MDALICSGLTALELVALRPIREFDSLWMFKKFVAVFLIQYAILKLYRIVLYPNFFSPLRHLPGPKDHNLVLGQEIKKFGADSPASVQLQWMRKWPDTPFIRYISFAGKEVLLVNSLAAHKAVLQTHVYDFVKPPFFARLVGEITGVGLLFSEGEAHKRERRLLAGPFSVPSMRKLLPVFQTKAKAISSVFKQLLGEKPYATLEAIETFSKSTMDTIGVTVLGIELDTISSMYPLGFQELYDRVLHQGFLGQLIWVINAFLPVRGSIPLEANRRFIQTTTDLRKMLQDIIQQRAADLTNGTFEREKGESRDLLTYMLEEAELRRQETGKDIWSINDIIGHLLNFTSAGHESTATTLSWSLYVLATNPTIQDRLRSEIDSLLETDQEPDYDSISALPYLHNFIREVLRVYPPSYMVQREATRDLVIEGVFIPKGTQVDFNIPLIHQHPLVWGPDATGFDPDRWDRLTGDAATPFAFEAFLQGPRTCPGRNFALIEVKAFLVELVPRWRFLGIERRSGELLSSGEERVGRGVKLANPSLTYRPADELLVRFGRVKKLL